MINTLGAYAPEGRKSETRVFPIEEGIRMRQGCVPGPGAPPERLLWSRGGGGVAVFTAGIRAPGCGYWSSEIS